MPKVTVIIPVFKVAAFAERCARSLMEQTLQDAEFIFVDDASPDESMTLIRDTCAKYARDVKFLVHPQNKGLPAARNTGLAEATGEYVWHCDSDDYPEPDFLEKMYLAATEAGADIAYCDFWLDYGTHRRYMHNPTYTEARELLQDGFLAGLTKYNVWNKIIRRSLYEGISFPEGHSMGEDMTVIALTMKAGKVIHVPEALYHYIKINANAYSNTFSQRHLDDIRFNVERILPCLEGIPEKYKAFFLLNTKLPFLLSGQHSQYKLWREWYPESNAYIRENRIQPARTRLVQRWAAAGLWPLVWAYSFLINRVFYGLLVRLRK